MIAKAGLGLIGLSAISVGGVALAKPGWLGMGRDPIPEWHSLSEDNGYPGSNYETGKFGNKYSKYLVGVTDKGNGQDRKTNDSWWEWSFRRIEKEKLDKGKFKELKLENSNGNALKKLCEAAYKKAPTELKEDSGVNITDDDFKKSDVWKYCSPGKLTTTSEDKGENAYKAAEIGGESTNKTVLVSVKNSDNDWFWEIRNKDFWGADGEWSGSKATNGDQNKKSIFKEEYEKNKDSGKVTSRQTIKKLCKEAYTLTKSGKENDNTDANRFCKLEIN